MKTGMILMTTDRIEGKKMSYVAKYSKMTHLN